MNDEKKHPGEQDSRFGLIVTALLILIIVALAGLWIIERGRRDRAEAALMNEQAAGEKKMQSMGAMLVRQMTQTPDVSVDRDQLATRRVAWDGRERTVFLLSASKGEKLGLQPGDAILITPPPATQPATQSYTDE